MRRATRFLVGLTTVLALTVACSSAATPTPTATPRTEAPTPTPVPTATPTIVAPQATPTVPGSAVIATPTPTSALTVTPTPGAQPKRGGIVTQSGSNPGTFDSNRGGGSQDIWINAKMYSNLVRDLDPTDALVLGCDLCESFQFSSDARSLTFKLRSGVKFHNGKVMDAEDIKYSLLKIMGLVDGVASIRSGTIGQYLDPKEPVTVMDPLTVRLNLVRPADAPLYFLATGDGGILPKDYPTTEAARTPVGTGPFTLKEYIKGSHAVFARFNDYFAEGQPYLDGVRGEIISGTASIEAAFLTGKLDVHFGASQFSKQNEPLLRRKVSAGEVSEVTIPYGGWNLISFNTKHPIFSDVRVRKAVDLAFDRQGMNLVVFDGRARMKLLFAGEPWGRSQEEILQLPGWRVPKDADLAEAKRLMAEAGYASGIDVVQLVQSSSSGVAVGEYLNAQLAQIGIRTTLDPQEESVAFDKLAGLNYVLGGRNYALTSGHPDEAILGYFITGAPRNWFGYSSPKLDALALQVSAELDPARKRQLIRQVEDIVLEDLPVAFVPEPFQGFVWYSHVKGIIVGLRHGATMLRFDTVWLDK